MKRILALLIACLMIVTCFVACDTTDTTDNGNDDANTTTGDENTDDKNTDDKNTGDENTGDENTGDENTGDENTGDENTGDENTGDENTGDENTPKDPKEYYTGKKCITFGDSITWYDGNAYNWGKEQGKVAIGYQHYMEEELGLSIINKGFSGQTMPQIMTQLKSFQQSAFATVDYMTIMSGANDERHGTTLGTVAAKGSDFNTTTYIGALQSGIEYALAGNPNLKIVLFTPIVGWIYAPAGYGSGNPQTQDGIITEKWANAVKEVAELYDLTVCDLYNDCEIQYEVADREAYMNDPEPPTNTLYSLHPNTEGYKKMAATIIATFKDMIK